MQHEQARTSGLQQESHVLEIVIEHASESFEELSARVIDLCKRYDFNRQEPGTRAGESLRSKSALHQSLLPVLQDMVNRNLAITKKELDSNESLRVHITDFSEKKGSLIILVLLESVVFTAEKYGALRQFFDYLIKDIRWFLRPLGPNYPTALSIHRTTADPGTSRQRGFPWNLLSTNLFWSTSGASVAFLTSSYPDHNKYKNLGAAILFTGIFAFISAYFALSYLTSTWWVILPVALLWGFTILNIDMLIVNTMVKYQKSSWRAFFGVLARVFLGLVIAIAISIPVEMTLLNDEIRDEIERHDRETAEQELQKTAAQFGELDELKSRKENLENLFNAEMQGKTEGSGRRGYGPIAQKIETQLLEVNRRIEELQTQKDSTLTSLSQNIAQGQINNGKYGFLASYRSLHRLQYDSEDNAVFYISWGIRILLFLIELLPIISKVLMRRGAYDATYELEEAKLVRKHDRIRKRLL